MNIYTAKFEIEDHLALFLIGKWGKEYEFLNDKTNELETRMVVELDSSTILYDLIASLSKKQPLNVKEQEGNIEIKIPAIRDIMSKKPSTHNYINKIDAKVFSKSVERLFRGEMNEYMDIMKNENGISYKEASYLFLEQYGIESFEPDSIRRHHARWRDKIRPVRKKIFSRKGKSVNNY